MSIRDFSRREFLRHAGDSVGIAWLTLNWSQVTAAVHEAHEGVKSPATFAFNFFTPAQAADVEAIAAQIIPSDDTPGAREAGVVYFIDRALATFFARLATPFKSGLQEFQHACSSRYPDSSDFASLTSAQQIEFLQEVDHTPFFGSLHTLTLFGMFSMPAYGGNRDGIGWKLLGFEDMHAFQPPFGNYDRDYAGFVIDPPGAKA
ncbi:gluconate 2-dehydrogenase subunit 3 family protein [Povalibacter sp.]|uniref:gluconate 2-dehydrogenase subunit 3 family protein n=1 Tax=Povalibacter sp. TaxID=1962978 RepID=UPI002F3FE327